MRHTLKHLITFIFAACFIAGGATAQEISALKDHDTEAPLDVAALDMRLKQKEGRGYLKGDVLVTQGGLTLKSDEMIIFYDSDGGFDNPTIHRFDASGGVEVVSASETVTAEWGVYDVTRRLITFGGEVVYTAKGTTIKGERLELDLENGIVKLDGGERDADGRVRGRFSVPTNN